MAPAATGPALVLGCSPEAPVEQDGKEGNISPRQGRASAATFSTPGTFSAEKWSL